MRYCFLDTNIFMQFQAFDEVDWPKVVDADEVCLVVPLTVIDELDKHKNDPISDRRRNRAKLIIGKLRQFNGKEVRTKTTLSMLRDNPKSEWFVTHYIDPYDNDAKIIGTAKWFWEQSPDRDVVTISNDYGFQLRAESLNMICVEPNSYLQQLPDEPDPQQKEIADLKRQLVRLQNATPKLSLHFRQDDELVDCLNLNIDFNRVALSPEEIEKVLKNEKESLSYTGYIENEIEIDEKNPNVVVIKMSDKVPPPSDMGLVYPSQNEVDQYHNRVNSYLVKFREYLRDQVKYQSDLMTTRELLFVLENSGLSPANDIDVALYFPDFVLLNDSPLLPPHKPEPPERLKPKSLFDEMSYPGFPLDYLVSASLASLKSTSYDRLDDIISNSMVSNDPVIVKSKVINDLNKLKQHINWDWPPIYVTFRKPPKLPTAFEVEYKITAANIPDVINGKLIIKLTADGTSS